VHVVGVDVPGRFVEVLGQLEVPAHRRGEDVGAPLVVGDGQRGVVVPCVRQVHLEHRPAPAPGVAVGGEEPPQHVGRLVDRDDAVRPLRRPCCGFLGDGRSEEGRGFLRQRPDPRPVHVHEALVADLLTPVQRPDHVDALAQTGVAHVLAGPPVAGDVLVGRLARAERHPEPPREHRGQRGRGLGDDRRVVALAGRVDHAERQ
jgi:hypothetical protein